MAWGGFGEGPGSGLDRIGDHDDGGFAKLGFGAGVAKIAFINGSGGTGKTGAPLPFFVDFILDFGFMEKEGNRSGSVVLLNNVSDGSGQFAEECEADSFLDMGRDE